jgi:hypothetical protein
MLADDFLRLEDETNHPETALGQEWNARRPNLLRTPQTRANFVISRVFAYLHPDPLTRKEKETEYTKLRKERIMAQNIGLMVRIFGHGIVPLMGKSAWKEA